MNMFKGRVESEGLKDNEAAIKDYWIPKISNLLESKSRVYYGGDVNGAIFTSPKPTIPLINQEVKDIIANDNQAWKVLTNKYTIILVALFIVLTLARFEFTNCLTVTGCVGMGLILQKLDEINERLKKFERQSKV